MGRGRESGHRRAVRAPHVAASPVENAQTRPGPGFALPRSRGASVPIFLDRLFALPLRTPRYQPLSKYPAVDRDFSFLFDDSVIFERIASAVQALNIAEMRSFQPAEIFRGGTVPAGKYSVLLRAQFQSDERTLRDDEVGAWSEKIIGALNAIGGQLRS